ncbi:hypothetical protein LCGC14_0673930 [marine sediment metagenome]|uniref:Nucleoside 2-deoxyribosyltransferase n=1 Tax=marine sediment metagenome TaxID=412755 RepID=A0A0F9QQC1_9ZZZZ
MGELNGTRTYLCGAMSYIDIKSTETWRNYLTPMLKSLGVRVFDPYDKPTDIAIEDPEAQRELISQGCLYTAKEGLDIIRAVDIRLVTISDFLIVNVDTDVYTVGTWEEVTLANQQNKPIITRIAQGRCHTPPWILAMLPPSMIFSTWDQVEKYLRCIDSGKLTDNDNRWMFFNQGD